MIMIALKKASVHFRHPKVIHLNLIVTLFQFCLNLFVANHKRVLHLCLTSESQMRVIVCLLYKIKTLETNLKISLP